MTLKRHSNSATNSTINTPLSIQLSLNGLSFYVPNKKLHIEKFKEPVLPDALPGIAEGLMQNEILAEGKFQNATLIFDTPLSAFVPKTVFKISESPEYLKTGATLLPSDTIGYDFISGSNLVNVYQHFARPARNLRNNFRRLNVNHSATVLVRKLISLPASIKKAELYIFLNGARLILVVMQGQQLILYNTFACHIEDEYLYYLNFVIEHLQLNPKELKIYILGETENKNVRAKIKSLLPEIHELNEPHYGSHILTNNASSLDSYTRYILLNS